MKYKNLMQFLKISIVKVVKYALLALKTDITPLNL